MDGAELYCFEDFESQLSPADELSEAAGKNQYKGTIPNGIIRDVRTDGYRTGSDDPGNRLNPRDVNSQAETSNQQLTVKLGHGNQQQDGRLDHPAFLGKSQGGAMARSTAAAAAFSTPSTHRFLHRGRTVDLPDFTGPESTTSRFRQGLLVRSQSTDEGKDVQRGPRELMSYSERRKIQLNQRTAGIKPGNATEMDRDNLSKGSVQINGTEPTESAAVLDHVDKLSVRARPDVSLHNKKNAKIRDGPPVTGLRAGRSGSPRSWNFSTQSIVPRFTNRDDSEILSAIRRSPTFKSSGDERRKPLVTNCSVDSALDQQFMESSSGDPNNRGFSMECLLTDKPETINIFGPGDLIKDVIFKTGSNHVELPVGLFVAAAGSDEKDGRLKYLSSRDVAPGLPPSGRGRKLVTSKLVRGRDIPATTEDLCDCGLDKSENTHKPVCRSLTAPVMSVTNPDDENKVFLKPKIPLGPRVSAPMLGISSVGAAWRLEDDETRNPPPSPSIDDTPFARATSQPYYAVPPKFTDEEKASKSNGSSGLVKLARRLSQKGDRRENKGDKPPCRQRSISVDSNSEEDPLTNLDHWLWPVDLPESDANPILRLKSGDVRKAHSMENLLQQTSDQSKASSIPPSPTAPQKLHRSWSAKKRSGSNTDVDGGGKDRTKRYSKQMTDSQALFEAVEHQDLDTARLILETNGLDVNQVNDDEFTALDIAVMTNNMPMARLLLSCGARENPRFLMKDARATKLNTLINEAEGQVQDMTTRVVHTGLGNSTGSTGSSKDLEKQLRDWEWRFRLLKRMKTGFEHARVPDHPACVILSTASSTSLQVRFEEPLNANGAAVTRYKVEWSCSEDFCPLSGEHILYDVRYPSYRIHGLRQGTKYYVRVSAFNMKGFGPSQTPTPPFAIPSCWRDMHGNKSRFSGRLSMIDDLFQQVRDTRPTDSGEIKTASSPRASPNQVRKTVRKSLKNFFQSAPKFQKHLKRGVYLASVMYNDDKVLVTAEDQLPIVEVDETFSSSIHQDFLWFLKVAGTWEDVDLLRSDLERTSGSSPAILFRARLLQAASLLQTALGTQDLGQVFYEPLRDSHGIIIITIINQIRDPRVIQTTSSLKWVNMNRIQKRKSMNVENPMAAEMLLASLPEKILYHQVSGIRLTKGLYLGYLKLRSSVDTIRVQVPEKLPSVLPHVKLRDNPNVSQEEWEWLHTLDNCQSKGNPTRIQEEFQQFLAAGTRKLLKKMGVTEEEALSHRLCDLEVIEMNEQVSVVLLFPPSGSVCLGPGTSDEWMVSKDYISIPVPVFEMVHMTTYQPEFIRRFTRLSSILEIDSLIAQQMLREAFSSDEVDNAKLRQQQVLDFQQALETTWKGMRWIMDVLQYARDKQLRGGVPLSVLYAPPPSPVDSPMDVIGDMENVFNEKDKYTLQIPVNGQSHDLQYINSTNEMPSTGILRVFPDYHSGLAKGTSLKLHVTSKTTCREIVSLVIQQLNKAVESHNLDSPIYLEEQWDDFGLVAIISNKEYQLRDDHCPLQLQNPWTKGHLYVRTKDGSETLLSMGPSTAV